MGDLSQQRAASYSPRELSRAIKRVSQRYRTAPAGDRHYAAAKLRWDSIGRDLVAECLQGGPLGRVLDVGCGRGQLGLLLLELGAATHIFGFDSDPRKAAIAAAVYPDHYWQADVRTVDFDAMRQTLGLFDTVLACDVLHYLTATEQARALAQSAAALGSGGRLIICDTAARSDPLSILYRAAERLALCLGYNRRAGSTASSSTKPRGAAPSYPSAAALTQALADLGMQVTARAIRGGAHYLLVARRPSVVARRPSVSTS